MGFDIKLGFSGDKGRGVFASRAFKKGETIEICPVILLGPEDSDTAHETELHHYLYDWGEDHSALALGLGSMYNHAYQPNAMYLQDFQANQITFTALRKIGAGEEICINYNGDPNDDTEIVFNVAEWEEEEEEEGYWCSEGGGPIGECVFVPDEEYAQKKGVPLEDAPQICAYCGVEL